MSAAVEIIGARQVAVELEQGLPKKTGVVARQVLNAGARRGRSQMVRITREQLNLPAAYVREQTSVATASDRLVASVTARKRSVQLRRFDARQAYSGRTQSGQRRHAGVTVRVKRGGSRETLPGAFLVKLRRGNEGLAIRDRRGGRYATGNRRFEVLYGPSVDQVTRTFRPRIVADLQGYVQAELQRRIALLVAQQSAGAIRELGDAP